MSNHKINQMEGRMPSAAQSGESRSIARAQAGFLKALARVLTRNTPDVGGAAGPGEDRVDSPRNEVTIEVAQVGQLRRL